MLFFSTLVISCIFAVELCFSSPLPAPIVGGTWSSLPPIPIAPRMEQTTVAVSDSEIFILGGIFPFVLGQTFDPTTAVVQSYSIHTNTWKNASSLPMPMNHLNAAAVDGKIYVLGGLAPAPGTEWPPTSVWPAVNDCWVYNPAQDTWTRLPTNVTDNQLRGAAAVGVHGKVIYLAGGMTDGLGGSVATVSAYDTVSGEWLKLPSKATDMPAARDHAGAAVIGNTFYVLGGRDHGQANVKDDVFALDLLNLESGWMTKEGKMPTPRGGICVGNVDGKVYTFGGEGNPAGGSNGVYNETEVYDSVSDTWTKLSPMPLPRHGTSAVTVGGRIFIPGGGVFEGGDPVDNFTVFAP